MILARKLKSAVRLYRTGGLATFAEFAWDQSRGYIESNALLPGKDRQRALMLTRIFNDRPLYSYVAFDEADVRACRPTLLLAYLRRQFHDAVRLTDPASVRDGEILLLADSLFRRWDFAVLDDHLPAWRTRLAATKAAAALDMMARRVALRLGRLRDAGRGLAEAGGDLAACLLRAEVLDAQGRLPESTASFEAALRLEPDNGMVRLAYGFHLLKLGRFFEGLENWGVADRLLGSYPLRKRRRRWQGEDLLGQTLLVIFEHGLGDMIQMSRFLHPLAEAHPGATILARVPGPLVGLLARSFPAVRFVPAEEPDPGFDLYVPSMQLPLVIGARSLRPTAGYLRLDHDVFGSNRSKDIVIDSHQTEHDVVRKPVPTFRHHALAQDRRPAAAGRRRIGICWRGHPRQYEATRSISIATVSRLFRREDADFVVLLNSLTPEEDRALDAFPHVLRPPIADFVELGAVIETCDLVVTVDTAVAHVAGAAGRPTLLLSRPDACWRWGPGGARSPWYDSIEVLRHPGDMDWADVLDQADRRIGETLASGDLAAPVA